jgi:hypothetical protein
MLLWGKYAMPGEHRAGYRIHDQHLPVLFYEESVHILTPRYWSGFVCDCSEKGIFVGTQHPLRKGRIVTVFFQTRSDTELLANTQLRGVVRWVKRFLGKQGMGIEIFEHSGPGEWVFMECLAELLKDSI